MSLFLQIALGILVAGGVGLGAWTHKHNQEMRTQDEMHQQQDMQMQANLTTGTANSDLDKDMITIDGQLKAIDSDSTGIDASADYQLMN